MTLRNQEPAETLTPKDCYGAAAQFHNHEFRTLGERTNLLLIVQSILISAYVLILVGQQSFGYIIPYAASGIVLVGFLFCTLHIEGGRRSSQSAFVWRQYMRSIEQDCSNTPWNWYYSHYRDIEGRREASASEELGRLPWPTAWLATPAIFLTLWFLASLYVPVRLGIDRTFGLHSCRGLVLATSIVVAVCALAGLIHLVWRSRQWFTWRL